MATSRISGVEAKDEGIVLSQALRLNFVGAGVTAAVAGGDPDQVNVTIPGAPPASGQTLYDAIVPDDFATPGSAFAGGAETVFVRKGTYLETQDINIPAGGALVGASMGDAIIDLSGGNFSVRVDGSGRDSSVGTVSATHDSAAVVGAGTLFQTDLLPGDFIKLGAGGDKCWYQIDAIQDEFNLTLTAPYRGRTHAGLTYEAKSLAAKVTVRNLTIQDNTLGEGLLIQNGYQCVVENVAVMGCGVAASVSAVLVAESVETLLTELFISNGPHHGVRLFNSDNTVFSESQIGNVDGNGVQIEGVQDAIVLGVHACGNGTNGINAASGDEILIANCVVSENNAGGIDILAAVGDCHVRSSTSRNNATFGLRNASGETNVNGCQFSSNSGDGIVCDAATTATSNLVRGNGGIGIDVNASNCVLDANVVLSNTGNGIDIAAGAATTLVTDNRVSGNATNIVNGNATTRFDARGTGAGLTGPILHNLGATANPTASNDVTQGYQVGSRWVNTVADTHYVCVDNAATAAIWKETTAGAVAGDQPAAQARRTTTFSLGTAFADINLDVTDFENDAAILNHDLVTDTDRIIIGQTGPYLIGYHADIDNPPASSNQDVEARVRVNDTTVLNGSLARTNVNAISVNIKDEIGTTFIANLTAGDFITLQAQRVVNSGTGAFNLRTGAIFYAIRLSGQKGDTGTPGAGSTVIIKDENINVPNTPHSELDFQGGGVVATDGGSGRAIVTVPGGIPAAGRFFASASDPVTTTSLTDELIPGMTVTPGAGDYFVIFTMTASHNKSGQKVFGSLYAAGVQASGTEREIGGQSNNLGNMACQAVVSVAAGQAIQARWRVSSNTGGGQGDSPGPRRITILKL